MRAAPLGTGRIAEDVTDNGGEATRWIGEPADVAGLDAITAKLAAAVAAEYTAVTATADASRDTDPATRRP